MKNTYDNTLELAASFLIKAYAGSRNENDVQQERLDNLSIAHILSQLHEHIHQKERNGLFNTGDEKNNEFLTIFKILTDYERQHPGKKTQRVKELLQVTSEQYVAKDRRDNGYELKKPNAFQRLFTTNPIVKSGSRGIKKTVSKLKQKLKLGLKNL